MGKTENKESQDMSAEEMHEALSNAWDEGVVADNEESEELEGEDTLPSGDEEQEYEESGELDEETAGEADEDEGDADDEEEGEPSHEEKSRLGRRVSAMEKELKSTVTALQDAVYQMQASMQRQPAAQPQNQQPSVEDLFNDDGEFVGTKKEVYDIALKAMEAKEHQQHQQTQAYQQKYLETFVEVCNEKKISDEDAEQLYKFVGQKYNRRLTGNPNVDCRMNVQEALIDILSRTPPAAKGKPNPIKGEKPNAPLGGSPKTKGAQKAGVRPVKLKKDAAEFANYLRRKGTSEEEINKVASGETKPGLQRKVG